jgi:carbonic anhydrase
MNNAFATAISCMDGRIQKCVSEYVSKQSQAAYVDTITLAGPSKIISDKQSGGVIDDMIFRLDISINQHGSNYIAVVGHYDCAGVLEDDETHKEYILNSSRIIQQWYPHIIVEALWVNEKFEVEVIHQ